MQNKSYVILSRMIFQSAIWRENPHVLKLFIYLFGNARHQKKAKKYPDFELKRGEILTSLSKLAEENEYMEGGRVRLWSRAKVGRMLEVLEEKGYITKLSDTYGTHISICNYEQYQNPKHYKADSVETLPDSDETGVIRDRDGSENNIKKEKKDKKGKKDTWSLPKSLFENLSEEYCIAVDIAWEGFVEMRIKIKKPMTDRAKDLKVKKLLTMKVAGEDIVDILNNSTSNNWTDLYPSKENQRRESSVEEKASQLS